MFPRYLSIHMVNIEDVSRQIPIDGGTNNAMYISHMCRDLKFPLGVV